MRGKDNTKAIPYLLPALVSILIVTCIPIIYTIVISFTNYNMYHLNDFTFIAFQNYLTVFSGSLKDVFFPVLGWTVCFAVLSTLGSYTMGLGLAILLNNPKMKESKVYKTILVIITGHHGSKGILFIKLIEISSFWILRELHGTEGFVLYFFKPSVP